MSCGRRIALSVAVVVGVGALVSPVLAAGADGPPPRSDGFAHSAPMIQSSEPGAVLSAEELTIGAAANGAVRIENLSSSTAHLTLTSSVEGSTHLARRLHITLHRHGPGRVAKLYEGPLAGLRALPLGTVARAGRSGSAYTFVFRAVLTGAGAAAGNNTLQGRAARARFNWTATAAGPG